MYRMAGAAAVATWNWNSRIRNFGTPFSTVGTVLKIPVLDTVHEIGVTKAVKV